MAQEETRKMKDFSSLTLTCILVLLKRAQLPSTRTRNNFQHARVLFTRWIRFCAAAFVRPTFWRKIFLCCESKKGLRNIFPHYYSGASSGEDKKPETEFIARLAGVGVNAPEVHSTRLIRVRNRVTVVSANLINSHLSILLLSAIGGYRIRLVQCTWILLHSVMHHGVRVHTNLLCGQGSCQKGYTKATEKATKWTGKQAMVMIGRAHRCFSHPNQNLLHSSHLFCALLFIHLHPKRRRRLTDRRQFLIESDLIDSFGSFGPDERNRQSINFPFTSSEAMLDRLAAECLRWNSIKWWIKNCLLASNFTLDHTLAFLHLNCVSWGLASELFPSRSFFRWTFSYADFYFLVCVLARSALSCRCLADKNIK